jgi:sarcosine oxidase subunit beta
MPIEFDALVVGAGITGCSATYFLAKNGVSVACVDKSDINTGASSRNSGSLHGQIQYHQFVEKGIEWTRRFLPALRLLLASIEIWNSLERELGLDVEVKTRGGLLLADSVEQMSLIETKVKLEHEIGMDTVILTREELLDYAPYVSDKVIGAELSPYEGKANPLLAAPAFYLAAKQLGAVFYKNTEVIRWEKRTDGRFLVRTSRHDLVCDALVICAGDGMQELISYAGINLPIGNDPIQSSVTEQVEPFIDHLLYYAGDKLTLKQAKVGSLLIGGGWPAQWEVPDFRPKVDVSSLIANLRVAIKVVPRLANVRLLRAWAGVLAVTPDDLPILGPVDTVPGLYVGIYPYLGFTAGPILGKILSELVINGGKSQYDLKPFSIKRFL